MTRFKGYIIIQIYNDSHASFWYIEGFNQAFESELGAMGYIMSLLEKVA